MMLRNIGCMYAQRVSRPCEGVGAKAYFLGVRRGVAGSNLDVCDREE